MQCVTIGADPISLYSYMAFGGESPSYSVSTTSGSGDMAMTMDEGHGFYLKTDEEGIEWLLDHHPDDDMFARDNGPNLAADDYQWTLHVMDEDSGQSDSRSWDVRIMKTDYILPEGSGTDAPEPVDAPDDANPTYEWADFVSSRFMPEAFGDTSRTAPFSHMNEGTFVKAVDLADAGSNHATGVMAALQTDDDKDVIWIGGLTPDVVLDVKVDGTTEGTVANDFNEVIVELYRHIANQSQADAIEPVASETTGYTDAYKDLDCGFYYLQISGEMGDYTLTWNAANLE